MPILKEKLIIRNFGPIKSVELELSDVSILIGEQGTGKSTVAKLLIGIRNTIYRDLFDIPDNIKDRQTHLFIGHLKLLGIDTYIKLETKIEYISSGFRLSYSEGNATVLGSLTQNQLFSYDFTYIPAERNLVFALSDSLFALMETGTELPKLFLRFGDKFQKARKSQSFFDYKSLLGINYRFENGRDILDLPGGEVIPANTSSSGLQTAVPFLIVLDTVLKNSHSMNLIVLEEPELNCFPATQQKIINYLISKIQAPVHDGLMKYNCQLLITTHSPYILTSLNNLLYAFKIGSTNQSETERIIEKKYWLDPRDLSAYKLNADGTCENIFDVEESMIKAEIIDSVSREINAEFDSMMDIELGIKQ